jgi:predicted nucleic acid-binding protein
VLRRVKPGSASYHVLLDEARVSRHFGLPLPALFEMSRGAFLAKDPRLLANVTWVTSLLASDPRRERIQVLEPLTPDPTTFVVAGQIHAMVEPPMKRRAGTPGSRPLAWYQDILIAATAWACGFDLVTEDSDFLVMLPYLRGLNLIAPVDAGL